MKIKKSPIFIIGITRSGTTILHDMVMKACPGVVDLTNDDDFECRNFWQEFGLTIGSRRTGTFCECAKETDIDESSRVTIQAYVSSRLSQGGLITKNPHLLNKIDYVANILPNAKFVLIVRDVMGVVASEKVGFNNAFQGDEDSPSFIHYWPDTDFPCWSYVKMDVGGPKQVKKSPLRQFKTLVKKTLVDIKNKSLNEPGKIFPHIKYSEFVRKYPDISRYYPGDGFHRLPESWLTLNFNAIKQLKNLHKSRSIVISYENLVNDTKGVVNEILTFGGYDTPDIDLIPNQLNQDSADKWKSNLTEEEQEIVRIHLEEKNEEFDIICRATGHKMLAEK